MTILFDAADCSAPWRASAAYLYTLDLDGPSLAWEYLRRNPDYRASWQAQRHRAEVARWGLNSADDPDLDARQVQPLWVADTAGMLHVRVMDARHASTARTFSVWLMPGRKRMAHAGSELIMSAVYGPHGFRAALGVDLEDGAACSLLVPFDAALRSRLPEYQIQASLFLGEIPPSAPRPASRAALLHLRALQALDAWQAGASHRTIAEALFGAEAVHTRWTADGELRAQVRHLLSRAEGFMRGGYLALAGVRQQPVGTPGDEPAH